MEITKEILEWFSPRIKSIAKGLMFKLNLPRDYLDDLIQAGFVGLVKAAKSCKDEKTFKTFAFIRIRGSMIDEIRNLENLPRFSMKAKKRINKAREQAKKEGKKVRDVLGDDYSYTFSASMIDFIYVYDFSFYEEEQNLWFETSFDDFCTFYDLLNLLSKREFEVLFSLFVVGFSGSEMSRSLNLSESMISRIKKNAINKAHKHF